MTSFKTFYLTSLICLTAGTAIAADNASPWTKEQVEKMCYGKANGNANVFDRCVSSNERKVGNKKRPGEALALDNVDSDFKKKATKTSPNKNNPTNNGNSSEQNKPKIF